MQIHICITDGMLQIQSLSLYNSNDLAQWCDSLNSSCTHMTQGWQTEQQHDIPGLLSAALHDRFLFGPCLFRVAKRFLTALSVLQGVDTNWLASQQIASRTCCSLWISACEWDTTLAAAHCLTSRSERETLRHGRLDYDLLLPWKASQLLRICSDAFCLPAIQNFGNLSPLVSQRPLMRQQYLILLHKGMIASSCLTTICKSLWLITP